MDTLLEEFVDIGPRAVFTTEEREHISGIACDRCGNPVWYSPEETFDAVDALLLEQYGNGISDRLNEIRAKYEMPPLT